MLSCFSNLSSNVSRYRIQKCFSLQAKLIHRFSIRESDEEEEEEDGFSNETKNQEKKIHLFKSRGQHLLTNPRILDTIVRKSNIKTSDTVLEIGPGTGNLTMKLLEACERVVAIEIDRRMVDIVQKRASEAGVQDRLSVICSDAVKLEYPPFDLVVANIPYGISSPLVAKLVFGSNKFRSATLLLQKEFARRLLANPGESEFNRLAANVKLVADVEFIMDVSKRDFVPIPKVDSSVVKIHPKDEIPSVNLNEWWAFTRTCFCKKNKTLGATFKQKKKLMELMGFAEIEEPGAKTDVQCPGYDTSDGEEDGTRNEMVSDLPTDQDKKMSFFRERVVEVLKLGGFESKRPSKLSTEELLQLLSLFNQAGVYFYDQAKVEDASDINFVAACTSV